MNPDFRQGKWRVPGRGRRLACGLLPNQIVGWVKTRVYLRHLNQACTYCGQRFKVSSEIGHVESVRFVEVAR